MKGKKIPGHKTEHGLPESSHSSSAYIKLDQNGNFYDPSFSLTTERSGGRSKAIKMTKAMKKHFKKYFKGVKI